MKVYLNSIRGIDDAAVSMLMSKRSWTRERELEIRRLIFQVTTIEGFTCGHAPAFEDLMEKLIKYGVKQGHTTLLRFIDFSFTVEGLHRAGQDDWDAHAARMDNRIVRASTRLADFNEGEISDYYKDKIKFPFEILEKLGVVIPNNVIGNDGKIYVRTAYGYIREDLKGDRDVKRGLYPEAMASNFTFKIQYPELGHIIQHRDINSAANPEVQQLAERIKELVTEANWWLGTNLNKIQMEPGEINK